MADHTYLGTARLDSGAANEAATALIEACRAAMPPAPEGISGMEVAQTILCAAFQALVRAAGTALPDATMGAAIHAYGMAAGILSADAAPGLHPVIDRMLAEDIQAGRLMGLQRAEERAIAAQVMADPKGLDS